MHGCPQQQPHGQLTLPRLCDIPSGCCSFTGPWTVTRSPLRMLRRVAAFCRPLRPVLLLVSFPRSRSPVVGVPGLYWMWRDVPFARQRRPIIGVMRIYWLLPGLFDCFCCPHTSVPPKQVPLVGHECPPPSRPHGQSPENERRTPPSPNPKRNAHPMNPPKGPHAQDNLPFRQQFNAGNIFFSAVDFWGK